MMDTHPLDNVIWNSLTTTHARWALAQGSARAFIPEVGPLGGLDWTAGDGYESLASVVPAGKTVALFLAKPTQPPAGWTILHELPLVQMVQDDIQLPEPEVEMVRLGDPDVREMLELTALTKPGPFETRTHELGSFYGIRRDGRLVAISGERLRLPGFTEVSAVCTHPDHLGKGYAGALMTKVIEGIRGRGETPLLHSREDNHRAIQLYERLGFRLRKVLHLMVLRNAEAAVSTSGS